MPADRLITLTVRAEGMRDDTGVYIPGTVIATLRPWVQVVDSGSSDLEDAGGVAVVRRKDFTLRWRADVIRGGAGEPGRDG